MKKSLLTILCVCFSVFCIPSSLPASVPAFDFPSTTYDRLVPAPEDYLGYKLGTQYTTHCKVVDYLETVAKASPRVKLFGYGKTYEGRQLVYLVISSEKNLNRIETLKSQNLTLADPGKKVAKNYYESAPVFVWLSYNIHGNEASCTETALALVYHLAADASNETAELLEETIVIVDPLLNPDGRDRYVFFFSSRLGSQPDKISEGWEHHEPWPSGRFNHYLFDLNRDWSWLTQTESRQRIAAYLSWKPQVHVDFHEMYSSSSYFFFPPSEPVNPNYPLEVVEKWGRIFGEANAKAFDERGWTYFSQEQFDMFYPGYGDSWPTFHGATGMTYEQAGHSRAGLVYERNDNTILSLADRISHHFVSSIATVKAARDNRVERLKSFREFFIEGVEGAKKELVKEYIISRGKDPARAAELAGLLISHGVHVDIATSGFKASNVFDANNNKIGKKSFAQGSYLIPLAQPLRRFIKSLMEPETAVSDTFFYDITAWSLPFAFGVDVYASHRRIKTARELVSIKPVVKGSITGENASYGYLIPWETNGAPKILSSLLKKGCTVRYAGESFTLKSREFSAGTLILPRLQNPDTLEALLSRLAGKYGVDIYTAPTSFTEKGIDLGSNKIHYIKPVHVAIISGSGTSQTSFGALWFLLDRLYDVRHSVVELETLKNADLSKFDVIIFPDDRNEDGGGSAYVNRLDSTITKALKRWIESGGVFVGLGGGAAFASADHAGLASVKLKKKDESDETKEKEKPEEKLLTLAEKKKRRTMEKIPGTILRVKLDPGHPLAFGYEGEVKVLKTSKVAFDPSEKCNNAGYFPRKPRVAGFLSPENQEFLALTPFLVEEKVGKGHVVLYLDDPNFRLFWYGLNRLLLNSIFFMAGN